MREYLFHLRVTYVNWRLRRRILSNEHLIARTLAWLAKHEDRLS